MKNGMHTNKWGDKRWYVNGKKHRLDGPAYEGADGRKEWYANDQLHRLDGPAVLWPNGFKQWFVNGKLHREDGPAYEGADGTKQWYLNDKEYSLDDWLEALDVSDEDKVFLKLKWV